MRQIRKNIVLREGAQVEILVAPFLYAIAKEDGVDIMKTARENGDDGVLESYCMLIYYSARAAWRVRSQTNTSLGSFPYEYMDFVEWMIQNKEDYLETVKFVYSALTGKDLGKATDDKAVKKK